MRLFKFPLFNWRTDEEICYLNNDQNEKIFDSIENSRETKDVLNTIIDAYANALK